MSLPDQLTVARVAAVPIVVLLFAWDFPNHAYWATAVFVVAMATDQIDGWLARRRGVSSALGKLLDPVADKVLVLAALVMLIGEGVAPAWMIALIVVREILVSGLRLAAVERGVVLGARDLGRAKTWAQAIAATVAGLAAAGMWSDDIAWWALLAALVATWVSGARLRSRGAAGAARRERVGHLDVVAERCLGEGCQAPGVPVRLVGAGTHIDLLECDEEGAVLAFLERRRGFDVHARSIASARLGLGSLWTTGCDRSGTSTISTAPRHGYASSWLTRPRTRVARRC